MIDVSKTTDVWQDSISRFKGLIKKGEKVGWEIKQKKNIMFRGVILKTGKIIKDKCGYMIDN